MSSRVYSLQVSRIFTDVIADQRRSRQCRMQRPNTEVDADPTPRMYIYFCSSLFATSRHLRTNVSNSLYLYNPGRTSDRQRQSAEKIDENPLGCQRCLLWIIVLLSTSKCTEYGPLEVCYSYCPRFMLQIWLLWSLYLGKLGHHRRRQPRESILCRLPFSRGSFIDTPTTKH